MGARTVGGGQLGKTPYHVITSQTVHRADSSGAVCVRVSAHRGRLQEGERRAVRRQRKDHHQSVNGREDAGQTG